MKPLGPSGWEFDVKKWQWLMMVDKLVKELNMKPDEIYKMNYIDCLNWLSLFNDKERWIAQQQKKQIDELKMNMKR